jgi:hypothetical protein
MATGEPSFTINDSANTSVSNSTLTRTGDFTGIPWPQQYYWTPNTYTYYWPSFQPDKTRQAFQIIQLLEEKKLIKLNSVKKFVALVDEIYKIL